MMNKFIEMIFKTRVILAADMEPGWTLFNGQILQSAGKNIMEQNNFTLLTFRWEWEQSNIQKKGSISHLF